MQVSAAQKGTEWFNERYDQDLQVARFQFHFPNIFEFEEVFLPDHKGDTLMYFARIDASLMGYSQISKSLKFNSFEADEARFYLRTHEGDTISNISQFVKAFKNNRPKDPNRSFNVRADILTLNGGRFYLENLNDTGRVRFNWRKIQTEITSFEVAGKDVSGTIHHLEFQENDAISVRDTRANFLYGPKGIVVQGLELITGRGHLKGDLTFITPSVSSYSQFVDSVEMMGDLEYSAIAPGDIQYFSDKYPDLPTVNLSGEFSGTVNDLQLDDFRLEALSSLVAEGELHLKQTTSGIDLLLETSDLDIKSSTEEFQQVLMVFQDSLPGILNQLGDFHWQGAFKGGLFNFETQSILQSAVADMELDLAIKQLRPVDSISYDGRINASRINIGALTGNNRDFGSASLDLSLDGKGFDPLTMTSSVKGRVQRFDYRRYSYQGMNIDGEVKDGIFEGRFKVDDPNLSLYFDGIASLGTDTSNFDFTAQIDFANLYATNWVKDSLAQFSGALNMDFLALELDRWEGNIELGNAIYRNSQGEYKLNEIALESNSLDSMKHLSMRSNMLDIDIHGSYSFKGLADIVNQRIAKYQNPNGLANLQPVIEDFDFQIDFKESAPLSQSIANQFLIEPGTHIDGVFRSEDQLLELNLESKGVRYQNHIATDLKVRLLSGYADLLNFDVGSYLREGEGMQIDSISLVNVFAGDSMNYQLDLILRGKEDSYGNFEGLIAIVDSSAYQMKIDQGKFNLGSSNFSLDTSSILRLDSNGFSIDWLEVHGGGLKCTAAGYISDDPYKVLRINVAGLDLDLLNYFIAREKAEIEGYLNGDIVANELLSKPRFLAVVNLDSLSLNQVDLGNMEVLSDYEHLSGKISIDAKMMLQQLEMLRVEGYYDNDNNGELDLDFNFNRFRLAALEPFAAPIAENLRGLANGTLSINGTLTDPDIKGSFALPKAGMTISFLQTDYNLVGEPKLLLDNQSIRFPNLKLQDRNHSISFLNGEVRHRAFTDFYVDLQIDARNLLVLNTTADREDAYYGTAFATGNIKVQGPPSAIKVRANVESEDNTRFYIPIGGATEVKQSGYVNFLPPKEERDNLQILEAEFALDEGVSLDFDMDINPNAQVSIILNESTGNQLDGKGAGLINMKLEPNRDLELYGTYTIAEGIYRFNLEGLFAKNFLVQEGGTVVWNGDPYSARLDLTALYKTKANPGILTGETAGTATDVNIYLYIKGELTNPGINFAIEMPRVTSSTQAIVANRLNTDQAINQQVFSLLAFNSFTPPSDFFDGTRNAINEWDLIAGQAAAFLNRFTGDYELSLSYQPASQGQNPSAAGTSQEELEVGLSKDFFNDRLTVNSSVEVPLNENNNSIAGDFELIYKLTADGRVRAKAFNRSIDNNFNFSIGQQQLYQQGLGITFKVDFETYRELWRRVLSDGKREDDQAVPQSD